MTNRFSPEVILASPEKAELVAYINKAKDIHKEIEAVDAEMMKIGALKEVLCHDEMRYEFSEDDDDAVQLFAKRVQLVKDLEALS